MYKMDNEGDLYSGLVRAIHNHDIHTICILLDKMSSELGDQLSTALILAASISLEIVKLVISRGADPHIRTQDRKTPLKTAALHVKTDIVQYLLSLGVDPNYANDEGEVALSIAVDSTCVNIELGYPVVDDEIMMIESLMRATNSDWHQTAYTCATDATIRSLIKRLSPMELVDPPEFGGPLYRDTKHYRKIPKHPLSREIWVLSHLCLPEDNVDNTYDANEVFELFHLVKYVSRHGINRVDDINPSRHTLCNISQDMRYDERPLGHIALALASIMDDKYVSHRSRSELFRKYCPKLFVAPTDLKNNDDK